MKQLLLFTSSLFLSLFAAAQDNLVVNGGFEKGINKGFGFEEIKGKEKEIDGWHAPTHDYPDLYMTPKKSVAMAKSGRNAIALVLGGSRQEKTKFEYITGKLTRPLIKDKVYCIQFNTLLHRTSKWAATEVGILLHHNEDIITKIEDRSELDATLYANDGGPVVNTKWMTYSGYYLAAGGEEYISFGKFGTAESVKMQDLGYEPYSQLDPYQGKAYYQLDDVSVVQMGSGVDCGCADQIPQPEEGDSTVVLRTEAPYLFALDASGSMKRHGLFDSLRQTLVRFVADVSPGTPVSFSTFSTSARPVYTGVKGERTTEVVDSLMRRASVGGGTNVLAGLQLAYESWDEGKPDSAKMILISDGQFNVTPQIIELVRNQHDTYGRRLTLIQIEARAVGVDQLEPYLDNYIYTTQSELSQAVAQIKQRKIGYKGIASHCDCIEEFADTMNYHFVIDYSGSMREEKARAIFAMRYLFDEIPDNAMISVTTFNTQSQKLYVGPKTGITMGELTMMLSANFAGGGTDPTPGIKDGVRLAESMSKNRYSHLVLITDYGAVRLSRHVDMGQIISAGADRFDLDAYAITVSNEGFVTTYSEFDIPSKRYVGVGRSKFENDLFRLNRSSCDFTSQPYHHNPTNAAMKNGAKRFLGGLLKALIEGAVSVQ